MERANSEDPFTVAATTGELIVDCKKVLLFVECFYNNNTNFRESPTNTPEKKIVIFNFTTRLQFSVDLLDLWLKDGVVSFLNSSSARILVGTNFCRNRFL